MANIDLHDYKCYLCQLVKKLKKEELADLKYIYSIPDCYCDDAEPTKLFKYLEESGYLEKPESLAEIMRSINRKDLVKDVEKQLKEWSKSAQKKVPQSKTPAAPASSHAHPVARPVVTIREAFLKSKFDQMLLHASLLTKDVEDLRNMLRGSDEHFHQAQEILDDVDTEGLKRNLKTARSLAKLGDSVFEAAADEIQRVNEDIHLAQAKIQPIGGKAAPSDDAPQPVHVPTYPVPSPLGSPHPSLRPTVCPSSTPLPRKAGSTTAARKSSTPGVAKKPMFPPVKREQKKAMTENPATEHREASGSTIHHSLYYSSNDLISSRPELQANVACASPPKERRESKPDAKIISRIPVKSKRTSDYSTGSTGSGSFGNVQEFMKINLKAVAEGKNSPSSHAPAYEPLRTESRPNPQEVYQGIEKRTN